MEKIERYQLAAKEAYDTLTQIGGRPTRPIRTKLHWKIVLDNGEQFYQDTKKDEKLFYYDLAKPRRAPHPTEDGVIVSH